MSLTTQEVIQQRFNLASLRSFASKNLKGKHWEEYRNIRDQKLKDEAGIKRDHFSNYTVRIDVEMRRIMKDRAAPKLEHKPSYAMDDHFKKGDLKRQAKFNVDAVLERQIYKLNMREQKQIEGVIKKANLSNQRLQEFNQIASQTKTRTRSRSR